MDVSQHVDGSSWYLVSSVPNDQQYICILQHDASMTCGPGMCPPWHVDEQWRASSDWEVSEWSHGPDSYSAPFQSWESTGKYVCPCASVRVCVRISLCKCTSPIFPITETALFNPRPGHYKCPKLYMYMHMCRLYTDVYPWNVTLWADICVLVLKWDTCCFYFFNYYLIFTRKTTLW